MNRANDAGAAPGADGGGVQRGLRRGLRNGWTALNRRTGDTPSPSRWAWVADVTLALAMAFSTLNSGYHHVTRPPDQHGAFYGLDHMLSVGPRDAFWAVMTALPLACRRRYPLAVFWACELSVMVLRTDLGDANDTAIFTFMSTLIAAYSAAIYSPYRAAMVYSLGFGAILFIGSRGVQIPGLTRSFVPFLFLIPVVLGANAVGNWKQRVHELEEEREGAMRRAVEQERARIAAELHDVVSHNVSVMVVQAGAARKVLTTSPELAREALLAVEDSGRAAMAELRHVMGLLTMTSQGADSAAAADLAPQPGLDQIPALLERVRTGGVQVDLAIEGDVIPLPSGLDLAAYRVVQEGLTNAVKHAVGALIRVRLDYTPQRLRVDVVDTGGTASSAATTGNGRGLVGLRQRLAVYGGTLSAGPRLTGGYMVSAVIPLRQGEGAAA